MIAKTTEEFIKEVEQRFLGEVSFEKTEYNGANSPCIITCPKHGDVPTTPHRILRRSNVRACPLCGSEQGHKNRNQGKEKFLEKLHKRFPDIKYDFSEAEYVDSNTRMNVICHKKDCNGVEHGIWSITPGNLYHGYGCPKCANEKTTIRSRMPYEDYCKLVSEKYGDIYEVDKNSYCNESGLIRIHCKKHNTDFSVHTRYFPKYNSHKCKECIKEELELCDDGVSSNTINDNDLFSFDEEVWVDVLGFEGQYQCSSEGRFKNINVRNKNGEKTRDRLLTVNFTHHLGVVCLGGKLFSASRKIYESFHKVKLPSGYTHTIDHIDNNVRNNRISNLRLGGSIRDNMYNNPKTRAKLSARGGAVGVSPIFEFDDLPEEKWVDAIGYENFYSVSNLGRVAAKERIVIEKNTNKRRIKRKHLMRQCLKYGQYYTIGLIDENGNHKTHYTHKLIYESFNGRIKEGNQVDHIDSNPINNKIENLREVTPLENVNNPNSVGKRKSPETHVGVSVNKLDLDDNIITTYVSVKDAARKNSVANTSMWKWLSGRVSQKNNIRKGYYFKVNEI